MPLVSHVTFDRARACMFTGRRAEAGLCRMPMGVVLFWQSGCPHPVEIWFN